MTTLKSDLKVKRNFLTRRYSWIYDASFEVAEKDPKPLLLALFKALEPLLKPESIIKNVKGRDRLNVINPKLELPFEQELLFCEVLWNPESFGVLKSEDQTEIAFSYFLTSPFDHFEERDIFHKVTQSIGGEAPTELSLDPILSDTRFRVPSFRIGLDFFGQSSFANWFFPTAVVLESLIIEVSAAEFSLRLQSENHSTLDQGYYDDLGFLGRVLAEIEQYNNIKLLADLVLNLKKSKL